MSDLSVTILTEKPEDAGRDRAPARAHLRPRPLCAHRLSHPRAARPPARSLLHGAHRHAAGRLGAADAGAHRRDAGAAARTAHRRAAVPRPRHRQGADGARAAGREGQGSQAGRAGRRRALLQAGRLQAHPERHGEARRPGRSGADAGRRTGRGRVRGRERRDAAGLDAHGPRIGIRTRSCAKGSTNERR